jgi:hypothetical protein
MSVRRAQEYTITFAPVESAMRPRRARSITFASGDVKVWIDSSFLPTTNLPVEIESSGRYALTLSPFEMDRAWVHVMIETEGIDPIDIFLGTDGSPTGTVGPHGLNSSTSFFTSLAEAVDDYWKDCLLLFTSGTLAGQVQKVSGYSATTHFITVATPFTGTPAGDDRFVLINL